MTNVELVAKKLAVLDEHLRRLRERRPDDVVELETNLLLQDGLAMSLLVVVQESIDIALHIASDEGWELAAKNREAFTVLERHGILDPSLATALGGAVQLRNRIAHGYASLDVRRLHAELPAGMAAFGAYAAAISAFLQRSAAPAG
jgi:uncharacterized protein YutE (UPF0331/DUF86 family)